MKTDLSSPPQSVKYSTDDFPVSDRRDWLREVIGQEYAKVEITPASDGTLFNEMTIYPWDTLRLSVIQSNEITLERLPREPDSISQDVYLAVVHLSGDYRLQQNGKEVRLHPGDMTLYDATLPHRINCSSRFSKLIVSIPRPQLRERIAGIEHCTALRIPGTTGIGAVTSDFVRTTAMQAGLLNALEFAKLSGSAIDLLTLALASVRPAEYTLSRSRSVALNRIKDFIERHLSDPAMNPAIVACGTGMSPRYLNGLFKDEDTSLMRYVWQRRLECCRKDLINPVHAGCRISNIAFRWGFNDLSHFSRAFKQRYGCSAKAYRNERCLLT